MRIVLIILLLFSHVALQQNHGAEITSGQSMVIAHRGASNVAPENTVASVRRAFELGSDGAEVDVRLGRDGYPVVIHDDTTERITGVKGFVNQMTLSELQALDAGSWKDERYAGERIPTLDQILEERGGKGVIVIEIKDSNPGIVSVISESLSQTRTTSAEAKIISYHEDILREFEKLEPDFATYLLLGFDPLTKGGMQEADDLIARCKNGGFEGVYV